MPYGDSARSAFDRVIARHLPPRDAWSDRVDAYVQRTTSDSVNVAERLLAAHNRTALVDHGTTVSYNDLCQKVLSFARGLRQAGVQPADRVAVGLPNGGDFAAAWLAVQWIGAIGVQLPTSYRRREVARVLHDSGARLVVTDRPSTDFEADSTGVCMMSPRELDIGGDGASGADPVRYRLDDPALITYIATAEGPLVGAVHTAGDLIASCETYSRNVLQLSTTDVCIGALSWSWSYGLGGLLMFPLHAGATTAFVDRTMDLVTAIGAHRATVLFGVPTTYRMLLRHPALPAADLKSLRLCVSAGEPLPEDIVRSWRARTGLDILDGFGTTELTHICISGRPDAVCPGSMGTPVPGYRVKILDEDFCEVADGVPGLLAVVGSTGATYWNNEPMQRRRVRDGWTLTGDVCVRRVDGSIEHVRRVDRLIVSAGSKISIPEVEAALTSHPDVASARVFAVADAVRGNVAEATVTAAPHADRKTLAEQLQAHLKRELAPFKCPRVITIV